MHRYAIEVNEDQAERLRSEEIPCEPLMAFSYKTPEKSQERDIATGRRLDEENAGIYENNQRVVQLINPVLAALHLRPVAAHPPSQSYAQAARCKFKEWLEDPTVRLREAIRFLAARDAFNVSNLDLAADTADKIAEQEEKERLQEHWKGKIPVGGGTWDGISGRNSSNCRTRWRVTQYHSFLKPHLIPETF